MQPCEPKIKSLETNNRFTEARLAIGSGDNPSPLAIDLSRRRSGGVSGPCLLVSASLGHVRSARHPGWGGRKWVGRVGAASSLQFSKTSAGERIGTSRRAAVRQVSGGVSRPIPVRPPPRPVPTFEVAAHRSGRDDHLVRTTMVRTRILDELFDLAIRRRAICLVGCPDRMMPPSFAASVRAAPS